MRKLRIVVAAVVMSVPLTATAATPAHACMGEICEAINLVCEKVTKGQPCVK